MCTTVVLQCYLALSACHFHNNIDTGMNQSINCNYARTSIRTLYQRKLGKESKRLSRAELTAVVKEYNERFESQALRLEVSTGYKRIPDLIATFNKKWHPQSQKNTYLSVFSLSAWTQLPTEEKSKHTLRNCKECHRQHISLSRAFPAKNGKKELENEQTAIVFTTRDLSSPTKCGRKVLSELSAICQENFKQSFQEVISETPRSKLVQKPSSQTRQTKGRQIVRSTKKAIQESMDSAGLNTVMANRISFRKYDKIRKAESLVTQPSTPPGSQLENGTPSRRHGSASHLTPENKEALLSEAHGWSDTQKVNWSKLAKKYGVQTPNGGQTIKEILREEGITPARLNDSGNRSSRRSRRKLPEGVPFPMHRPSIFHKKKLDELLQSGEVEQGSTVVPTTITSFNFRTNSNTIVETTSTVYARKISLHQIRERLLKKHEDLGLVRGYTDRDQSVEQLQEELANLGETTNPTTSTADLKAHLRKITTTRHFKIWHDHSTVAGHGHFLVLISAVYDPAFYLTAKEARQKLGKEIDVQSTIEAPEVHILGRSTSSLDDQATYNACRRACLSELSTTVSMSTGEVVFDVVRFFHGDGPAQQFESGNTVGGNYCCVGCGVKSDRMDDIAYTYRCAKLTLADRQEFLLKGRAWKNLQTRPLDKLLLSDLQSELRLRDRNIRGKKKPALLKEFDELKMGISNFPALLQEVPNAPLKSLYLENYEISPTEPLHDLKGHLSNVIDESLHISEGKIHEAIVTVKKTVLSKDAIRCSDLRKAVIIIYLKLKAVDPTGEITDLYRTAVEICNLCYAHDCERTPRSILCLHNRTFLHAHQCSLLFANPQSITRRKMFGRYFHSLASHAALMFRVVSLRSLNTEQHERIFQQAKGITKGTTNNHAEHIITNIINRLQFEESGDSIATQESEIKSLAKAVGPMKNTVIPQKIMDSYSAHYQAHLERISDYLIPGPGVWWKRTSEQVEFLDGTDEEAFKEAGPQLLHFRSTSTAEIDLYLFNHWESLCISQTELPAFHIRHYNEHGSLQSISSSETLP